MSKLLNNIGKTLKLIRLERDLKISEVVTKTKLSENGIRLIEKGKTNTTILTLAKLLECYNVDLLYFVQKANNLLN